ncbi:hypothetical protein O6H91_17G060000 [Diphasiastrum complanatum]|uniref:Uncharacterized protein n=1 Tax=Diphasiastrum complanatum TaxID=34168 RepID=A0ACC2B760_DIPCM|nr:hypothetical protein O6H91_17G060000 [Diphasiastrum complanatum]
MMAAYFTLPELRAELHALGHDDVPDHVIMSFLSQLQITPPNCFSPTPNPTSSSEAETEAEAQADGPSRHAKTYDKEPCIKSTSFSETYMQNFHGRENASKFSKAEGSKHAPNVRQPLQPRDNMLHDAEEKQKKDEIQRVKDLRLSVTRADSPHSSPVQYHGCFVNNTSIQKHDGSFNKLRARSTLKLTSSANLDDNRNREVSASDGLQFALDTCEQDLLALNLRCCRQRQGREVLLDKSEDSRSVRRNNDRSSKHKADNIMSKPGSRRKDSLSEVKSDAPTSSSEGLRTSYKSKGVMLQRGGKIDRVARFAEMQKLWNKDSFLKAVNGKRKSQSFHRMFAELHASHLRKCVFVKTRSTQATHHRPDLPFIVSS